MVTRRSWIESTVPVSVASFTWVFRCRNRLRVSSSTNSRILLFSRLYYRDRTVVYLLKGLAGALGGPLFQVDIPRRPHLQNHRPAIAHAAIHAAYTLLAAAIQIVRQAQNRNHHELRISGFHRE